VLRFRPLLQPSIEPATAVTDFPRRHALRFGVFEADLDAAELRKRGLRVRLPLQAFRVLQLLIENPMRVVSREELRQTLWPAEAFGEFDHGLNNAISRLRDVLNDSSTSPRFIETLPRRGYRFIAPVEPVVPAADAAATTDTPPASLPEVGGPPRVAESTATTFSTARSRRRFAIALTVGALAVIVATAVPWPSARWPASRGPTGTTPLAVLPLAYNAAGADQPDHSYLADGMTDALISELSQISSLRVISATSSTRYKNTNKSLPEIARELGVEVIVEGSVFREGDVVRVTVQLIRADTDTHLLTQTYTRPASNVLALQSDVALLIAREIGARITPQEQTRMARVRPVDPEAYRLYVLGNKLRERQLEPELRQALDHFQEALKLEPEYARAYGSIAETWIALSGWTSYVKPREGFPRAKAAAMRALSIDPSFAEAHSALAFVSEVFDRDFTAAEQSYQRALTLSPNDALAHNRYSLFLNRTGREKEGVREAERAYELDPLSLENSIALGLRLVSDGRRDEGMASLQRAAELDPTYFETWVHLAEAYLALGKPEDAVASAKRAVDLSRGAPHAMHMLASIQHRVGRRVEANALLRQLEHSEQRSAYEIAVLRLTMGDIDEATQWFVTACEERTPQMAFFHFAQERQPFEPVRRHARFGEIVRCLDASANRVLDR
jgi:TolB-like protein/DNA-binding winged helix-turn-helix (wHTH) protein/Tfp pilus assembly protein PilF